MIKVESKELDNSYYDVDVVEEKSCLSELLSVISVSIRYAMDKHNMTYDDVINQVNMFFKDKKIG